jgi:glycosyltransferase involved in cell wall biosynthesis
MNERHETAIILHLYYTELWDEIASYLANLENKFDLFVSVPFEANSSTLASIIESYPAARIIRYGNRGRDIASFLEIFSAIAPLYKYVCKIHSKRTLQLSGGDEWRQSLYNELLGSRDRILHILSAFESNPAIGMIGPASHVESIRHTRWTGFREYREILTQWAEIIGVEHIDQLHFYYFAGSMFWFKSEAMRPILDLNITLLDFEQETGVYDGTIAHALERFFPVAAFSAGFQIFDTDLLAPGTVSDITPVYDEAARLAVQKRVWKAPDDSLPGVNLVGPVEFINGVSLSSRGYAKSLAHAGIALNVVPWRNGFERLNRIEVEYPTNALQPLNLIHLNLDLLTAGRLLDRGMLADIVNKERYNICIPYWELSTVPPEWLETLNRFDEIWCASTFMANAFGESFSGPVKVIRPSLDWNSPDRIFTRKDFSIPEDKFIFFYAADIGSIIGRKNHMALVQAYIREFKPQDGAYCLVKINYANRGAREIQELLSLAEQRADIMFMDKLLEEDQMRALFDQIDCYVSPHRSEGLGLTVLEAMSASKPVIATPYGGVTDFVTQETAFPIDFHLAPVGEGNFPYPAHYLWADPSIDSLQKQMRHVFQHREAARETALRGKALAASLFSVETTAEAIRSEIQRIWHG